MTTVTELQPTLDLVADAVAHVFAGNPAPYATCWDTSDNVTLFGAFGTREKGHHQITETLTWVAGRFSDGTLQVTYDFVDVVGDLAYTVGFERGTVRVDGGDPLPMTIRVTHIYKRIEGDWRLVHRHGDHPPTDPRNGLTHAQNLTDRTSRPGTTAGDEPETASHSPEASTLNAAN